MAGADGDVITVERIIPAPPQPIFALLVDPARHPEIDGSGAVRRPREARPPRLSQGETFEMAMRAGVGYSMRNRVIEFEPDRLIAWQTFSPGLLGRWIGGRIWRYRLEPVPGGTKVQESWDIRHDKQRFLLRRYGIPRKTAGDMSRTLERIEQLLAVSTE